ASVGFWKTVPVRGAAGGGSLTARVSVMQPSGGGIAMRGIQYIAGDQPRRPFERHHATIGVDDVVGRRREHGTFGIGVAQAHEGRREIASLASSYVRQ